MRKLGKISILLLIFLVLFSLLKIERWAGYTPQLQTKSSFNAEQFFQNLQNITWTLYIGPNKEILNVYSNFLKNTDEFLHIQSYTITHQTFKDQFQNLSKRWIPVHIILENKVYNAYQNYFRQLQDYFSGNQYVKIQSDEPMGTTYVHSKITVNEDAFRIQTANLTKSSFEKNREHFFFSENEEVRSSLVQLFERDWKGEPLSSDQFHPNLVVCPINCRTVVEHLLSGAEQSIIIQTQYIFDEALLHLLRQKSEEVDLNIIVADTVDNQGLIHYFGPSVARKLTSKYNHTKMILVDGKYLLLGSMNLSDNSLDNNREIWIMLLDPSLIQQFEDGFRKDWRS